MVRAQRTHLNILVAAFVAGTVAIACGGDKKDDDTSGAGGDTAGAGGGDAGGGGGMLTIAFNPMYSAFDDNAHDFKVPVKVTGATGKLTVKTSPDGFVSSEPSPDGVMLTTKKAGKCDVTITDEKGNSGTASLTVTQNDPTDVDIGKERYANGIDAFNLPEGGIMFPEGGFMLPEGGIAALGDGGIRGLFGDGGFRVPEGGLPNFGIMRNDMSACTFCHIPDGQQAANQNMMQIDVEHTPQQTAGYSDEDLINIFTMGKKPAGAGFRIVNGGGVVPDALAAGIYMRLHTWNVAPETQKGLVAYLRSLTPKAQAEIDFGGLLRGGLRPGGAAGAGGAGSMDAGAM
jgi:hypothetical protein